MASWDYTTSTRSISAPQAGKYWLKTVTMNISNAPAGKYYYPDNNMDESYIEEGQGSAWVTVSWDGGSATGYANTTGWTNSATSAPWWTHGNATGSVTVTVNQIILGAVTVTYGGGWVGSDDINATWDWAYANFTFSYVDGYTNNRANCQYGKTITDSHGISHVTNYHGNTGTPALQTRDQSYTSSGSVTVTAEHCAQYPNYISISVPGQSKSFVRKGDGIVLPTKEDYLFEGWWGVQSSRSGRDSEWLDGRDLGTHGTYNCYAHYMSPPVWERKNGEWHKWIPDDMNAQSVKGTKTVNNIRSKHNDDTWPLDKPIYQRQNGQWVQLLGAMIPPMGS